MPSQASVVPRNVELMEQMSEYSIENNVSDILGVLLERLLKEQPENPLEYLIKTTESDPTIIELSKRGQKSPNDLRPLTAKKELVRQWFELLNEEKSDEIPKMKMKERLLLGDSSKAFVEQSFPKHANDIMAYFTHEQLQYETYSFDDFAQIILRIINAPASQ